MDVRCPDRSADSSQPVWLQGANGSGKTTLLRCIGGWIVDFEGRIEIDGAPVSGLWAPRPVIALFPNFEILPPGRTFASIMATVARYAQLAPAAFARAVDQERGRLGAQDIGPGRRGQWSTGETKLLALSLFFALNRPVKLLDEPFASLDEQHRERLASRLLEEREEGNLVIYTDHHEHGRILSSTRILMAERP